MERNKKKIILSFKREKKILNKIPESYEDLKNSFFESFSLNPSNNFHFLFINKVLSKVSIDKKKEEFKKQIDEISRLENPEIIVLNEFQNSPSKIDFLNVEEVESEYLDNKDAKNDPELRIKQLEEELKRLKDENKKLLEDNKNFEKALTKEENNYKKKNLNLIQQIKNLKDKIEKQNDLINNNEDFKYDNYELK